MYIFLSLQFSFRASPFDRDSRAEKKISVKVTRRSPVAAYVFSSNVIAMSWHNFCFDG